MVLQVVEQLDVTLEWRWHLFVQGVEREAGRFLFEEFRQFLDDEKIAAEDRIIRRIALRGGASEGVAVTRNDLIPEVTITADGVYWHPVGAEDNDLLVTRDIFPLSESFAAVRRSFDREREHANKLARIFNCA